MIHTFLLVLGGRYYLFTEWGSEMRLLPCYLRSRQVLVDFYYTEVVFYGGCVLPHSVDETVPYEADAACPNQAVVCSMFPLDNRKELPALSKDGRVSEVS